MGFKVNFKTAPNIPTFKKRLAAGEYGFAYMNPYHYTVFNQSMATWLWLRHVTSELRVF
ncbi:MAG: ABC-type phosphate/phosphonate transport system substrate-binding protein [Gammaproteobacteria bacterium]|jgi:ABC-type phosphate/phosphonate transport system substrate-binding protein